MHRTIFKTPIINTLLRQFSIIFLRLSGWKIEGHLPAEASKCVFIAAPHTSNWDLPFTLMVEADGPVQLVIPPEGTRSKTRYWKTGFYYIALEAKVPILMAYMDYSRKISGIGPLLTPSGNIENDMQVVKDFYAPFKGKNADQFDTLP